LRNWKEVIAVYNRSDGTVKTVSHISACLTVWRGGKL